MLYIYSNTVYRIIKTLLIFIVFFLFSSFDNVKILWMNLKKEAPELCVNFEDFLYRMSNQMKQKVNDYQNLENILRTYVLRDIFIS